MRELKVNLKERSYPILVGENLEEAFSRMVRTLSPSSILLITDPLLYPLYGKNLEKHLGDTPRVRVLLPPGEKAKNLKEVTRIYRSAYHLGIDRNSLFIILGGGSLGDTGGFAAATYLRGVRCLQVATTLLAMVDSSIGGKTGVDFIAKNIIGAFHQPSGVISDVRTLLTLPERNFRNGIAEVVKYGLLEDTEILDILEEKVEEIKEKRNLSLLEEIVYRCARIKARIVEEDEKEKGLRRILNLGHTLGHALEAGSDYRLWHGEAVSLGLVGILFICSRLGGIEEGVLQRVERILTSYDLPIRWERADYRLIYPFLLRDKKKMGEKLNWVVLEGIGNPTVRDDIPEELIEESINFLRR